MTALETAPARTRVHRMRSLRGAVKLKSGHSLYWWAEVGCVLVFYTVYSAIRNSVDADQSSATAHALQVIRFEKAIGIFREQAFNHWATGVHAFIVACNYYYGSLHFLVTLGVGIFLFKRKPDVYARWRNTIAIATALALIGFWTYQLLPPRLLNGYGFIDTLARYGTPWNWNSKAVSKLSNQFAAMPSVHCAWALWCGCALVPQVKRWWAKMIVLSYPTMTVAVVVFTANHYFVDAVAGFATVGIGYIAARRFTRAGVVAAS